MADQDRRRVYIANGIISGLVLACGTVFSALTGVYFDSFFMDVLSSLWVLGFAYIVPGLIGLMATWCQTKGGYIAQMVFCILTLLAMGIYVVVVSQILTGMSYPNESCNLSSDAFEELCTDTAGRFFDVAYSIIIIMILGWLLTLVITILGGVLACRPQPTPQMELMPMSTVSVVGGNQNMNAGWTPNMTIPQVNQGFQVETSNVSYHVTYTCNQSATVHEMTGGCNIVNRSTITTSEMMERNDQIIQPDHPIHMVAFSDQHEDILPENANWECWTE